MIGFAHVKAILTNSSHENSVRVAGEDVMAKTGTTAQGVQINTSREAKRAISRRIVDYAPEFTGKCSKLNSRARVANKNMKRIQAVVDPTLKSMQKDLKTILSELSLVTQHITSDQDVGKLMELRDLLSFSTSGKLYGVEDDSKAATAMRVYGALPLVKDLLTTLGAFTEDTSTALNAEIAIEGKLSYLSGLSSAGKRRIDRSEIKKVCSSPTPRAMVEQVCTAHGLGYRRMMKGRVEGKHPAWDDPCDRYSVTKNSKVSYFTHPPRTAPNWFPVPGVYARNGLVRVSEASCLPGRGCGTVSDLYGSSNVDKSLDALSGFFSGPGSPAWQQFSQGMTESLDAYDQAINQAFDKLYAVISLLDNPALREAIIGLLTAAVHLAAATLAITVPGVGLLGAFGLEITTNGIAHVAWGAWIKRLNKSVTKRKKEAKLAVTEARKRFASAETTWSVAAYNMSSLAGDGGEYARARQGVLNFDKAIPKIRYCRKVYPTRTANEWKRLAGDPRWECPLSHISTAPRERLNIPVPGSTPHSPGGFNPRIPTIEAESAFGATMGQMQTRSNISRYMHLALIGGVGYWLWKTYK